MEKTGFCDVGFLVFSVCVCVCVLPNVLTHEKTKSKGSRI